MLSSPLHFLNQGLQAARFYSGCVGTLMGGFVGSPLAFNRLSSLARVFVCGPGTLDFEV